LGVGEWKETISPLSSKRSVEIGVPAEKVLSSEGKGKPITSCHGVFLKFALSWLMQLVIQHAQKHLAFISFNRPELSETPD